MLIQDNTRKEHFSKFNQINLSYYYLFNLQKRIYIASKEGHVSLVCSLQRLLSYLRSIKLLAKSIIKQKNNRQNNHTIKQKSFIDITKRIISWCLEAEWIPKIHHAIHNQVSKSKNKFTSLFVESFLLHANRLLSNIDYKYLANKLQPVKVIQTNVQKLLRQENFTNYTKHQASQSKLYFSQTDHLYYLLTLIIINGNHWHYFRQIKFIIPQITLSIIFFKVLRSEKYISHKTLDIIFINLRAFSKTLGNFSQNEEKYYSQIYCIKAIDSLNSHNYYQIEYLYQQRKSCINLMKNKLYQQIKNFLFHKDHLGRLRINNSLNIHFMTEKILNLVKKFREYQIIIKQKYNFSLIKKMVIDMCYYWLKKKYKKRQTFETKTTLSLLKQKLDNIQKL